MNTVKERMKIIAATVMGGIATLKRTFTTQILKRKPKDTYGSGKY